MSDGKASLQDGDRSHGMDGEPSLIRSEAQNHTFDFAFLAHV